MSASMHDTLFFKNFGVILFGCFWNNSCHKTALQHSRDENRSMRSLPSKLHLTRGHQLELKDAYGRKERTFVEESCRGKRGRSKDVAAYLQFW